MSQVVLGRAFRGRAEVAVWGLWREDLGVVVDSGRMSSPISRATRPGVRAPPGELLLSEVGVSSSHVYFPLGARTSFSLVSFLLVLISTPT